MFRTTPFVGEFSFFCEQRHLNLFDILKIQIPYAFSNVLVVNILTFAKIT